MVGVAKMTVAAELRTCSIRKPPPLTDRSDQVQTGAEGKRQENFQTSDVEGDRGPGKHDVIRLQLQVPPTPRIVFARAPG